MTVGNPSGPFAQIPVAQYTPVTTTGTTTITGASVFIGVNAPIAQTGTTSTTVFALDGTSTILGTSTVTAVGQSFSPFSGGGLRVNGALAIVVAGTGPNLNVLWD